MEINYLSLNEMTEKEKKFRYLTLLFTAKKIKNIEKEQSV